MIKILSTPESCPPEMADTIGVPGWEFGADPFPAYRANGARYRAFQPVGKDYQHEGAEESPSRMLVTQKGTNLLVPCNQEEDERILLVAARGGFRGHFRRVEAPEEVETFQIWEGSIHCTPMLHVVARLNSQDGYVMCETGRRSGKGLVQIFSWNGYKAMSTEEYEFLVEQQEAVPA